MWLQLLMKLAQADPTKSKNIKQEDLDIIAKKYAEQDVSVFGQSISSKSANSLTYAVEMNEDGSISDISVNSKKSADQTTEEKSLTDTLKALFSIDKIKQMADSNKDGTIDDAEIKGFLSTVSKMDEDATNISIDDFSKLLTDLDVELGDMINKTAQDILKADVLAPENKQELTPVENTEQVAAPQSLGEVNNSNSGYTPVNRSSGSYSSRPAVQERTADVIQKEITAKEDDKTKVNTDADAAVKSEEDKVDKAVADSMKKNNVNETVKKEYESQKAAFDTQINEQSKAINDQEGVIQDNEAIISSKNSAITSVNSQISTLEGQKNNIVDSGDAEKDKNNVSKRQEIDNKINELKENIKQLETDKKNAETAKAAAVEAKSTAEQNKATAEQGKSDLLKTLSTKFPNSGLDNVAKDVESIKNASVNTINGIKDKQKTAIDTLNTDIQTLKTELAQLNQQKETKQVIQKNSFSTFDANFDKMMDHVFGSEGGLSNDKNDHGGLTNYGITEGTYRAYTGDSNADVSKITKEQAKEIYYKNYYQASGADELQKTNPQLSFAVFDAAVNHGVGSAKKLLDQSGGDVNKFMELRKQKYINIVANDSSQAVFEKGWQNRWNSVYSFIDPNHKYENYVG